MSRLRPASRCHLVLTGVHLALASTVTAQTNVPAARPAFENLRFREDWSAAPTGDPLDPLKHIALSTDGRMWLSLGGHMRVRGEAVRNFLGGGAGDRTDAFGLARTHLHADLHVAGVLRTFVELRHADVNGRDLPGGARAIDRDRHDLANAFVELTINRGTVRTLARLGRQELMLGRERIVSPLDWVNVRRVFHGASVEARRGATTWGAFVVRPVIVHPDRGDAPDARTGFGGATLAWSQPPSGRVLEGALLVKHVQALGATPVPRRWTATARAMTPVGRPDLVLEVEGGFQRSGGSGATHPWMIATDLAFAPVMPWSPSVTLGVDRSSGTQAGGAPQQGTWDQLYPLGHAYAGFADVFGRRNLIEERLVVQAAPRPSLRLRAAGHAFQRSSRADAAYDVSGAVFRPAALSAPRGLGTELDVTAQWKYGRHLRLDGGVARFAPGAFLRATGSARPYSWVFASLSATF